MKLKAIALGAVTALAFTIPANAVTTHTLTATSNVARFGDFTIDFEDKDGDGLFSLDELVSFSGVLYSNFRLFDTLTAVADAAGATDGGNGQRWGMFASGFDLTPTEDSFNYSIQAVQPQAVPLPAALPLLLGGLAWIGFAARGRRKSA